VQPVRFRALKLQVAKFAPGSCLAGGVTLAILQQCQMDKTKSLSQSSHGKTSWMRYRSLGVDKYLSDATFESWLTGPAAIGQPRHFEFAHISQGVVSPHPKTTTYNYMLVQTSSNPQTTHGQPCCPPISRQSQRLRRKAKRQDLCLVITAC
jgi:hypothetical protein